MEVNSPVLTSTVLNLQLIFKPFYAHVFPSPLKCSFHEKGNHLYSMHRLIQWFFGMVNFKWQFVEQINEYF